jgi:membrane protein
VIDRIKSAVEAALWHPRYAGTPAAVRGLVAMLRIGYAVLRDIATGQLTLRAMGLVYVTLLSIVPLIALSFSLAKAFGMHRQLEPLLYNFLLPLGERGVEITDRVMSFVDNVQGDVLAGLGLIVLFFTAMSMAQRVEDAFNFVWRVNRPRSFARRLSEYLSVIIVGPVAMVTALTLLASIEGSQVFQDIASVETVGRSINQASKLTPYAIVMGAFTFVYWFLPNTRVRFSSALAGGVTGGVIWATTGAAFAALVVDAANTRNIYATFAILITALLWVYICWLVLLIGAQVSFYVQNPEHLRKGYDAPRDGTRADEKLAVAVMTLTAAHFSGTGGGMRERDIAESLGVPGTALNSVIDILDRTKLVARTSGDALLPTRAPEQIAVREVLDAMRASPRGSEPAWPDNVALLFDTLDSSEYPTLEQLTIADLASRD